MIGRLVLRADCKCTALIALDGRGGVVCSGCRAPVHADGPIHYTGRGPRPDGVSEITFRRTCARGDVVGAEKIDGVWRCTRAAWENRKRHRMTVAERERARPRLAKAKPTAADRVAARLGLAS